MGLESRKAGHVYHGKQIYCHLSQITLQRHRVFQAISVYGNSKEIAEQSEPDDPSISPVMISTPVMECMHHEFEG